MAKQRKSNARVKDARSTGRKRGRAVLEKEVREGIRKYACECVGECGNEHKIPCGYIPPPPPEGLSVAEAGNWKRKHCLDVQHQNKNILDNDPANLSWKCRTCHKGEDSQTEKGVSLIEDEFGYGDLSAILSLED